MNRNTSSTMTDARSILDFAMAGRAVLTLSSRKTGRRYTYRITHNRKYPESRLVSLLAGPENLRDYTYLGMLRPSGFHLTPKSRLAEDAWPVVAFRYFTGKVLQGPRTVPAWLEVRHVGKCGRCGRALTVPESIDRGIGPECAAIMSRGRE